jgi:malonate-semialdehyde dehydrogenase (acetylating) / methylmalonate-semialdehyde dehydrogenase
MGLQMTRTIPHWINGKPTEGTSDRTSPVTDPARGQEIARVVLGNQADVDAAVGLAQQAYESWRDVPALQRSRLMARFVTLLDEHRDDLARIISREHGKTHEDALGEVARGVEVVEFAAGIPHLLKGEASESVSTGIDTTSWRQPLGVVAGITPFNFPAMVGMWMFPIALACGNSFILKPSEKDPSAALLLAELLAEAGLADGLFNVVQGDADAVNAILDHPGISAVSFVGSTPVARHVYSRAAASGKRVQALGGAKNHAVVMPDAVLERTANALLGAVYGSTGQRCMAVSAVVAVGGIGDKLIDVLRANVSEIKVGAADDPSASMGPLVTLESYQRVRSLIDAGVEERAELVVDGRDLSVAGHEDGYFLGPCIFDNVTPEMSVYREEIFGPVMVILRVDTLTEALKMVNANPYGNGAAIFTQNGYAARRFQQEVTAGMVGVNVPIPVPLAFYSFGGWKQSLFGDSHVYGPESVQFYTRGKVTSTRWFEENDPALAIDTTFPSSA